MVYLYALETDAAAAVNSATAAVFDLRKNFISSDFSTRSSRAGRAADKNYPRRKDLFPGPAARPSEFSPALPRRRRSFPIKSHYYCIAAKLKARTRFSISRERLGKSRYILYE